jgi:hypothetical protein
VKYTITSATPVPVIQVHSLRTFPFAQEFPDRGSCWIPRLFHRFESAPFLGGYIGNDNAKVCHCRLNVIKASSASDTVGTSSEASDACGFGCFGSYYGCCIFFFHCHGDLLYDPGFVVSLVEFRYLMMGAVVFVLCGCKFGKKSSACFEEDDPKQRTTLYTSTCLSL